MFAEKYTTSDLFEISNAIQIAITDLTFGVNVQQPALTHKKIYNLSKNIHFFNQFRCMSLNSI